jgi:hypothetical protein
MLCTALCVRRLLLLGCVLNEVQQSVADTPFSHVESEVLG